MFLFFFSLLQIIPLTRHKITSFNSLIKNILNTKIFIWQKLQLSYFIYFCACWHKFLGLHLIDSPDMCILSFLQSLYVQIWISALRHEAISLVLKQQSRN